MPTTSAFYIHRSYAVREAGTELPNALTACDTVIDATDCNQLVLYVGVTLGNLADATLELEFSDDKTTWYGHSTFDVAAGGLWTVRRLLHIFANSLRHRIEIHPIMDKWIRVRVAGTGSATGSDMVIKAFVGTS